MNSIRDSLSEYPFLNELPDLWLDRLSELGQRVTYPTSHRIFAEGGRAEHFWLISAGDVGLDLHVAGRGDVLIETIHPGSVIRHAMDHRRRYGRVSVIAGARTPADLLYPLEYLRWQAASVVVRPIVDRPDGVWDGAVGVVTALLPNVVGDPARTVAMLCGPEVMMKFAARALMDQGLPAAAIQVSLERNMRCGIGECGHCQLGPLLVCRDGPVTGYDRAEPLLSVKEL